MINIFGHRLRILVCLAAIFSYAIPAAADNSQEKYNAQITGYVDPAYDGQKFKSIIVYAPDVSLENRSAVEENIVKILSSFGIFAQRGIDIIPPTRDQNISERNDLLAESGVQATLTLKTDLISSDIMQADTEVFPGVISKQFDPSSGTLVDHQGPPIVTGGEVRQIPKGTFTLTLSDNRSGGVIWKASVQARGIYKIGLPSVALLTAANELRRKGLI